MRGEPGARGEGPTLAVVVKGWPRLSETFVAQELLALERAGFAFEIWSLRRPTDQKRHPLHLAVQAPARYLQEYLRDAPWRTLKGLGWAMTRAAFWTRVLPIWLRDLARDRSLNRIRRLGQACTLARELPPGVRGLYVHFLHTPASVARYAGLLRGLPWGFSAHAKDIWTIPEWEIAEKLGEARFGVTCTAYGAEKLRSLAPEPGRVGLVYHGLDLSRFPPAPEARAPLEGRPFAILSVGRLVEKKGFDRLIEAFALLPPSLDWRWTHLGGGPLKGALAARAAELGVGERLSWRGAADQTEVIAAMRAADLFALPSRVAADGDRDGLPNVLMEAASQKTPILSTPVAAIPEFIVDGVHGVLSSDAPADLATAIAALAAAPERRARMAEAAHARLYAEFDARPGVATLSRLIGDLLEPAAARAP